MPAPVEAVEAGVTEEPQWDLPPDDLDDLPASSPVPVAAPAPAPVQVTETLPVDDAEDWGGPVNPAPAPTPRPAATPPPAAPLAPSASTGDAGIPPFNPNKRT